MAKDGKITRHASKDVKSSSDAEQRLLIGVHLTEVAFPIAPLHSLVADYAEQLYLRLSIPRASRWVSFIAMTAETCDQFLELQTGDCKEVEISTLEGGDPEFMFASVKARRVTASDLRKEPTLIEVDNCFYRRLLKAEDVTASESDEETWKGAPTDLYSSCVMYMMFESLQHCQSLILLVAGLNPGETVEVKNFKIDDFIWTFDPPIHIQPFAGNSVLVGLNQGLHHTQDLYKLIAFLHAYHHRSLKDA